MRNRGWWTRALPLGVVAAAVALGVVATAGAVTPAIQVECDGLQRVVSVPGLCTHGPDAAPAATGADGGAGDPVPRRGLTCVDGGVSGQRVEVLHLHGASSGASSEQRRDILRWSQQVEWTVNESARRLGGDRRVRWRMSGCDLRITSVRVSNAALGDFGDMVGELRDRGYRGRDRSYLLFVDSDRYCGIATAPRDDGPGDNRADSTAGYARVDRPCWGAADRGYHSIAAHELLHTLGAVQASAPHGTTGAHCTDEHDLLCYDDGTGDRVRVVCRDRDDSTSGAGDANDRLLDCGGDDYFHPDPPRGSYLDRHWNTADSARLHDPDTGAGSGGGAPSPTGDPVGYALWLLFG
jgi:hypothetical protein